MKIKLDCLTAERIDSLKKSSYSVSDTLRDRREEIHGLHDRISDLLNRPDIDEMNKEIELKRNRKWDSGMREMESLQNMCVTKVLPKTFKFDF